MSDVAAVIDLVDLVLFTLLAIVALRQWRAGRGRQGLWAALTFLSIALVVDAGRVLGDDTSGTFETVAVRILLALLVLFPYFLYRFTAAFRETSRAVEIALGALTASVLTWTFLLPSLPEEGESWSRSFSLYIAAFLVHWGVLATTVAVRLFRAGAGEPTVARRRMQLIGFASAAITVALFAAAGDPSDGSVLEVVIGTLTVLSALAYLVAIAPPLALRVYWRRPEARQVQAAVAELMSANTTEDVVDRVLPPMARIVGARSVLLLDRRGEVLARHGPELDEGAGQRVEIPVGSVVVWSSAYAPYFGDDELATLRTLAALTALAIDRVRLFAQEQAARRALERADELKTSFIARAAHELRTPVTGIGGIVETLDEHGDELGGDDRNALERALREQARHMRVLVEQLLDLSRLDAEAVEINPRPLDVRGRVEQLVASAAGRRATEVEVDMPFLLEVAVDHTAFDRIVTNLVVNALKYGEPPIVVSAENSEGRLRVTVEDRGAGIEPELVPSLFDRFTRGHESGSVIGTGLGLAIARSYAQAHDGELVYRAAHPCGARFELVLPAS